MKDISSEGKAYIVWRFVTLFLLIVFVVTSSFLLFLHSMQLDMRMVKQNAPLVLGNVFLLSLLCCLIEWLLRKFTTDRVVKQIKDATSRMASGDFSVRIDTDKLTAASRDFNQIARDLNQLAEELAATETLQTDFISNVSHELKTPLAVVRNYATLLNNPALTDVQRREYTAGISQAVDRTTTLMSNILRLNKLENQQRPMELETYDVGEQVAECLAAFSEIWDEKGVEIEADIDENLLICAEPELMTVVWNNLISNAIKFTEPGGTVSVSAQEAGDWIEVKVQDTGCGMDEKTGRHIFDKFYQGDTSHATEGNGLGLAMVKRIVDLTGSEISVDSELGRGSTFTVRVRKAEQDA